MTEKKAGLIQLDDDELQQTLEGLRQLPRKGRSLREVIAHLHAEIQQTLAKGYSYREVVAFLAERGIAIAEPTLRQYIAAANKTKRRKEPTTKEKTPKVHESYTPDISKKGGSDARNISDRQASDAQNISSQQSPDARNISNQRSTDTQPRRTVGKFVEMPDEL
jgi:vacuolar-type H+-ATPase subunit H